MITTISFINSSKIKGNVISCKAGSYLTNKKCQLCKAGTYSKYSYGSPYCIYCSAGSYSKAKSVSCTYCQEGTFSKEGAATCTKCPNGQTSGKGYSYCYNK